MYAFCMVFVQHEDDNSDGNAGLRAGWDTPGRRGGGNRDSADVLAIGADKGERVKTVGPEDCVCG